MLSTALGFSKGKIVTDHCSILALDAAGFLHGYCHHELNESTEQMAKLSFIMVQRDIQIGNL